MGLPEIISGHRMYLWDRYGNKYIDASSGAICVNLGHGVDEIAEAEYNQSKQLAYVFRNSVENNVVIKLENKLLEMFPTYKKVFFTNSGSEATELAFRIAHLFWLSKCEPQRRYHISRWISYHGITLGALAVSGHHFRRDLFQEKFSNQTLVDPCYYKSCPFNHSATPCKLDCIKSLINKINQLGSSNISSFIFEPIVGASGLAISPHPEYFKLVAKLQNQYNFLTISDEVLVGLGRTGSLLALDNYGIEASIVLLGKGLGAGYYPISAVLIKEDVYNALFINTDLGNNIFTHTYAGTPKACAVALAVLEYMHKENVMQNVKNFSDYFENQLRNKLSCYSSVIDIRGKGFLWGIEFKQQENTNAIYLIKEISDVFLKFGLIVYPSHSFRGLLKGVGILVAPPLNTNRAELDELIQKLQMAIQSIEENLYVY